MYTELGKLPLKFPGQYPLEIFHSSYDNEYFEEVTTLDFNGTSSYKAKDNGLFGGYIYYRVTAIMSDGTSECSPVEMIKIVQHI
jgi:hypothetical protein